MTKPTTIKTPFENSATLHDFLRVRNEQQYTEQADKLDPGAPWLRKFLESALDPSVVYPDPVPLVTLNIRGTVTPLLCRKGHSLWHGKQKSKKTTVLAMVAAGYIRLLSCLDAIKVEGCDRDGVVIWYDCEQGTSYAARTYRLIRELSGASDSDRIIYVDLRGYTPKERREIIKAGIANTPNVALVIVDGLVDLMTDFMDAAEGQNVISELLALCNQYDIHIAGVLHQNKADRNARSHIGSIASQKCEIEIAVDRDDSDTAVSVIKCERSRGLPFEDFAIRWDAGALPHIVQDFEASHQQQRVKVDAEAAIRTALKGGKRLRYRELTEQLQVEFNRQGTPQGEAKVRIHIRQALTDGLLITEGTPGTKTCTYALK